MFRRKATMLWALISLGTVLGFIAGVAPGYFIRGYALYGIGAGFFTFLFLFIAISTFIVEYPKRNTVALHATGRLPIFHQSLTKIERILLSFTSIGLFFGGAVLGILCELLLKGLSGTTIVRFIIAAAFIAILLVVLVIMLIMALIKSEHDQTRKSPTAIEPIRHRQIFSQPADDSTQSGVYRWYDFNDDAKPVWSNPSMSNPLAHPIDVNSNIRSPSTIRREYQRLLQPSHRFRRNDKVYVNDKHLAKIIGADSSGFYSIQYIYSGMIDYKHGKNLRKASVSNN